MKATNQGFVDLHTPFGFMLVGVAFLAFTLLIAWGAIYFRQVAAREQLARAKLKKELLEEKRSRAGK